MLEPCNIKLRGSPLNLNIIFSSITSIFYSILKSLHQLQPQSKQTTTYIKMAPPIFTPTPTPGGGSHSGEFLPPKLPFSPSPYFNSNTNMGTLWL